MDFMNLNRDVQFVIARQYPSLGLSYASNKSHEGVNMVFDLAVRDILPEMPFLTQEQSEKNSLKNKIHYFNFLAQQLESEAKRLGCNVPDLSHLPSSERMLAYYGNYHNLIQEIKMKTPLAQQEAFDKFVKVVAGEVGIPILPDSDLKEVWSNIKKDHLEEKIESLDLSTQHLKFLPPEIGSLKNLKMLYLDFNQIRTLPEELKSLTQLETLSLNHNSLTSIPESIQLPKLKRLELRYNKLEQAPHLNAFPKVQYIFLHHNKIKDIPADIDLHPSLKSISFKFNPIEMPFQLSPRVELEKPQNIPAQKYLLSERWEDI